MADRLDLSEVLRRTVQANARFYKGWMDLSLEYMRGITEIFGGGESAPPASAAEEPEAGPGVIVVEAEEGTTVRCAFLVTNDLGRKLSCELYASEFTGPDGAPLAVAASFDPPRLELEPGEQRVVHALVPIDGKLVAGVAHTGSFAIRGMDGFSVPVVLRRRHGVDAALAATQAPPPAAQRTPPAASQPGRGAASAPAKAGARPAGAPTDPAAGPAPKRAAAPRRAARPKP
jgi:hypothetical protein